MWQPYCHQFAQSVKEQEKFITWAFFLPSSPLLTHSRETKLRQQASGETITGPLLFQSWGHPSAQCSRNKGQGFIAGSTVWKETHSNIVWFSEIVDRHPCCFLWMVYKHIIAIKQVGLHQSWRMDVCFTFVLFFCSMPASPPAEVLSVTVFSCWGCHPCFLWHVDGHQRQGGRKEEWMKGSRSQNHPECVFFFFHKHQITSGKAKYVLFRHQTLLAHITLDLLSMYHRIFNSITTLWSG